MYRGIDVSRYQGNIDFRKVKDSGIEFVIARVGYGQYEDQKDPRFEENYNGSVESGLPIGVYLYSYALSVEDSIKEAEVALRWLNNRKLNLPVYYDIEDRSQINLGRQKLTDMCLSFCRRIEEGGYKAGVYANKYWLTTILNAEALENDYSIWVAEYARENTYDGKYDMWQYTSTGRVDGIETDVDLNILYNDIFDDVTPENPAPEPERGLPDLNNY